MLGVGRGQVRSRWISLAIVGMTLVNVSACSSHPSAAHPSTSGVKMTAGPGIFAGEPCDLVSAMQFDSILGSKVGPGQNDDAMPVPNGVTSRACQAATNDGNYLESFDLFHYPSTAAAAAAFQGVTTSPPLGRLLALSPGLAPHEFANVVMQGGVIASAYFLDGLDELAVLVTTSDVSAFNETAFVQVIQAAARKWRHL
jgi:hypothetical protein